MSKRSSKNRKKKSKPKVNMSTPSPEGAWLPSRTGLIILAVVSLALAVWVTVQGMKVGDFGQSVLYGLGFGASIWVVFGLVFFVNKVLRGR